MFRDNWFITFDFSFQIKKLFQVEKIITYIYIHLYIYTFACNIIIQLKKRRKKRSRVWSLGLDETKGIPFACLLNLTRIRTIALYGWQQAANWITQNIGEIVHGPADPRSLKYIVLKWRHFFTGWRVFGQEIGKKSRSMSRIQWYK